MAKLELLWKVDLPFFKVLFTNSNISLLELNKLHDFLKDIWFDDETLVTYHELKKIDITNIDREKVKKYNDKVIALFATRKYFIISLINKTDVFNDFISQLNIKLSVDKNRILEIIFEYIYLSLISLVTNYETQRVAKWIFDIVKK